MPTAHQVLLKKLKEESEKQYPKKESKKNGKIVKDYKKTR